MMKPILHVLKRTSGVWISLSLLFFALAGNAAAQNVLAQIPLPSNSCCTVAVDPANNRIYVSSGFLATGNNTTVVNGSSLSVVTNIGGVGGVQNVDPKNDNFWVGGLFAGNVQVFSGSTDTQITAVSLSGCPGSTSFDCNLRHVWVTAQCGGGNDPVWVVNANTFRVLAGPIGSGGVMGPSIVNPATGKFYVSDSAGHFEVNPSTFAITSTPLFGTVLAVNPVTDHLYAAITNGLQIIAGGSKKVSETIKKTVTLTYTPNVMGVNNALDHLYTTQGGNSFIDVRNDFAGNLLSAISLGSGVAVDGIGVDSTRGRIYAVVSVSGNLFLYVIEDLTTARVCQSRGSC